LDTIAFWGGGFNPVICAKNYGKREGVGLYISYGGKDALTDAAVEGVLGSICVNGETMAETAMDYSKYYGRCEIQLLQGTVDLSVKVDTPVDITDDLGDAAEHTLNVVSAGAGWGDMLGAVLGIFRAIDKLQAPDAPRGAKGRLSGYFAQRVLDNVQNRDLPYQSLYDLTVGKHENRTFSFPQRDVFVGDLCLAYVDLSCWAQQKSEGYLDWWEASPGPECWADIKITPDAGFSPKYMLYEIPH
jgi:hypothetical protein